MNARFPFASVHMIGIGGSGMSGIAEVLLARGVQVSGSDIADSEVTRRLRAQGAVVSIGHAADHLGAPEMVVVSSAIREDNPELLAARQQKLAICSRATMLGTLMQAHRGVAIAGTHGKTTTSALVAHLLVEGGKDPSCIIGGHVHALGSHARVGAGEWFVAEADESDASFLGLRPEMAIVTNVDRDHMDTYGQDERALHDAFCTFLAQLPHAGLAVVCMDDAALAQTVRTLPVKHVGYGIAAGNDAGTTVSGERLDLWATDVRSEGVGMRFTAASRDFPALPVLLNLAGMHNVRNALAAIAIARAAGCDDTAIARALASFKGVGRRFDSHGEIALPGGGSALLIDDYGHHPTEIAAVITAARGAWPTRRIVVGFQPHRYTRTRDLFPEFVDVLSTADDCLLCNIYAAGESPIAGVSSQAIAEAMRARSANVHTARTLDEYADAVLATTRDGDVVLNMGAGSIASAPALIRARLLSSTANASTPVQRAAA